MDPPSGIFGIRGLLLEDCFFILYSAEMFVRISGDINIRDINIRSGSGLKDGHGQTTEGDSSDEDDEEYHTASFVSKGRAPRCMNNQKR